MGDLAAIFDRRTLRRRRARTARRPFEADFLRAEVAARLAERLDDIRRAPAVVLELGAQRGELRRALAEAGRLPPLLVEAELEPALLTGDRARLAVAADEERLPFGPGRFDAVFSVLALHWVNDLPGTLTQARWSLKPDGLFLAAFPGGRTLGELRWALTQAELELEGGAALRVPPFVDVRDAGALLQRAGFALPVADLDRITVRYREPFRLIQDLRAMGEANVARGQRRLRPAVLARALALYRERFGDADGTVPATFEIVFVTGWAPHASQPAPLARGSGRVDLGAVLGKPSAGHGSG